LSSDHPRRQAGRGGEGHRAPICSTLYFDTPMRGHTLMQTIARANRVYGDKVNGLIVDNANVF